jgi:hypothetical protein
MDKLKTAYDKILDLLIFERLDFYVDEEKLKDVDCCFIIFILF